MTIYMLPVLKVVAFVIVWFITYLFSLSARFVSDIDPIGEAFMVMLCGIIPCLLFGWIKITW